MALTKFEYAIDKYLKNEGGYQNFPSDKGNYNSLNENVGTNFGISAKKYEETLQTVATKGNMVSMSITTAKNIYKNDWVRWKLDSIKDTFIAAHIFDILENHGYTGGSRIIQKAINSVSVDQISVDGVLGTQSINAINKIADQKLSVELNKALVKERSDFYRNIGNSDFLTGWLNRANKFLNYEKILVALPFVAIFVAGAFFF